MGYCSTEVITFCPVFVNSGAFQQPPKAAEVMDTLTAPTVGDEPTPVLPLPVSYALPAHTSLYRREGGI